MEEIALLLHVVSQFVSDEENIISKHFQVKSHFFSHYLKNNFRLYPYYWLWKQLFRVTRIQKSVFWLKKPCFIPEDFDWTFCLAQSTSVLIFWSFLSLGLPRKKKHLNMKSKNAFSSIKISSLSSVLKDEKLPF